MKRISFWMIASALCATALLAISLGCSGASKAAKTTTPPPAITPKFVYVSNCDGSTSGSIGGYSVDATTGALTAITGSPVATGLDCPSWMGVNPAQTFLFAPDIDTNKLYVYSIGATGALTAVTGSPYTQCGQQAAVDPSGKFLIVPDDCSDNVAVYSIGATGALTAVTGSPFSGTNLNSPDTVSIDPGDKWVYIAGSGKIHVFSLAATGALAEATGSPVTAGTNTNEAFVTPNGKYIYANGGASSTAIMAFSVDTSTGALTALSTPEYAGGSCWLVPDANSAVLFSTDCEGNLYSSAIGSDGALTAATGSPLAVSGFPYAISSDPSGKFFYAGADESSATIAGYSYTSSGALTAITGSPFGTGAYMYGMVVTH
jgi:6-phosphogluconolactonase